MYIALDLTLVQVFFAQQFVLAFTAHILHFLLLLHTSCLPHCSKGQSHKMIWLEKQIYCAKNTCLKNF
jgi:hypothetical protein